MSEKNINPIANYLLAKGFDKNAIIGALINMGQESGWSPYSDEKPSWNGKFYAYNPYRDVSHGYGLVQYSFQPIAQKIWDYCHSGKSEWECIKYQLDMFPDELGYNYSTGGSWNPSYKGYGHFRNYWTNKYKKGYEAMAYDFLNGFERGVDGGRVSKFAGVVLRNVKWDGVFPEGTGTSVPEEKPTDQAEKKKVRALSLQECLSFLDRARPQHEHSPEPGTPGNQPTPSEPTTGAIGKVMQVFNEGRSAGLQYSQPLRNRWPQYADCSSFLTRCVNAYMGLPTTTLYTTDSLHDYIERLGWKKIFEGNKHNMPLDSKEADIIITGVKGHSLGNAGHTMFVIDSSGNTIECTGVPARPPYGDGNVLCKSTLQAQRDVWLISSSYWYKYRRG